MPEQIKFYKTTSDPRALDKDLNDQALSIEGTFKNPFDIRNPVFLAQTSTIAVQNLILNPFNYAVYESSQQVPSVVYKRKFKYFVDDIKFTTNNLIEVSMRLDVLGTYSTEIKACKGMVSRNELQYLKLLEDKLRPLQYKKSIITEAMNFDYDICVSFNINRSESTDDVEIIALTCFVNNDGANIIWNDLHARYPNYYSTTSYDPYMLFGTDTIPGHTAQGMSMDTPDITTDNINANRGIVTYLLTKSQFARVQVAVSQNDTLASFIIGAVQLPFSAVTHYAKRKTHPEWVEDVRTDVETGYKLVIGGTQITAPPPEGSTTPVNLYAYVNAYGVMSKYIFNAYSTEASLMRNQEGHRTFIDYEPYSNYEVYIPFYGWMPISADHASKVGYALYYSIDLVTGEASANLMFGGETQPTYTVTCQIGTKLPITTTNARELENQRIALATKTALGAVGAIASVGIGIASANPVAVAGGVLSGAKTIGDAVNTNLTLLSRGQVSYDTRLSPWYSFQYAEVKRTACEPTFADGSQEDDAYRKTFGKPLNMCMNLSSLHGFTIVSSIFMESSHFTATESEKSEIRRLLADGVYFPYQ